METIPAKTILQKNKSTDWFGSDYNMNLYKGCCHGCIYCDSRSDCYQIENFSAVRAKENCLQILRDELRRKVRTGVVGTGAMCDPYSPFEETEQLTRHAMELIDAFGFGAEVLTKSSLIARDADIFCGIAEHSPVLCQVTVTAAEDSLSALVEPNVSRTSERINALAELSEKGLSTGVVMTPLLPFIEDTEENVLGIVRMAKECGARAVYPMFGLTMRSGQREYFYRKLEENFPDSGLAERYAKTYGERYECYSPHAKRLWKVFSEECQRLGLLYEMRDIISAYKQGYGDEQLSFF
ncbi:MAG: radical SAM protein [Oscillospiraceae bacterium]|nr:radical SAM protein [Oscillospiraceae bacterium]